MIGARQTIGYLLDYLKVADLSTPEAQGLLKNGLANICAWILECDPETGEPSKAMLGRPSPFNLIPVKHPIGGANAPSPDATGFTAPAAGPTGPRVFTGGSGSISGGGHFATGGGGTANVGAPGGAFPGPSVLHGGSGSISGATGGSGSVTTTARNGPAPERLGLLALVTHTRRAQERGRGAYPRLSLRKQEEVKNLSGVLVQIKDGGAERGEIDATAPLSDLLGVDGDRACLVLYDSENDPWQVLIQQKSGAFLHRPQSDFESWFLGQRGGPTGGEPVETPVVPGGRPQAQTQITDPNKGTTTPDHGSGGQVFTPDPNTVNQGGQVFTPGGA